MPIIYAINGADLIQIRLLTSEIFLALNLGILAKRSDVIPQPSRISSPVHHSIVLSSWGVHQELGIRFCDRSIFLISYWNS